MKTALRSVAGAVVRRAAARLPRSASRLTGELAENGGRPVRNTRIRPWGNPGSASPWAWVASVGPAFRSIFLSGIEGLPQLHQKRFAAVWAEYCGCRHGLLLPHGTDALRLGLAAALDHDGLAYGGEVIVPNLTFIASATAALDRRFGVALVDVDEGTLNLDPQRVQAAIIPGKTRAILAVHQFGQPADMTSLSAIAHEHGLKLIEDAAQAHGALWESGPVGSLGDAAGFSFQSSKNLACGEGGILTTNDDELFARAYSLHNVGRRGDGEARWEHDVLGWNCRPTEYQAALLMHRFVGFEKRQQVRASNFQKLRELLSGVACVEPLAVGPGVRRHAVYMFVMRYLPRHCGDLPVDEFVRVITAEGVPLRRAYTVTVAEQAAIRDLRARRPEYIRVLPTPVSDRAVNETVYLPGEVFLGRAADMHDIAAAVRKVQRHYTTRS